VDSVPSTVALGSDGSFYLSAPFDDLPIQQIPADRRFFLGVATKAEPCFADAVVEFLERTEPRVLGFDGRVYIESSHAAPMGSGEVFYGYAATDNEAAQIQQLLAMMGMEVFSILESRPKKAAG